MKLLFNDAYYKYLDYIKYRQKLQSIKVLKERFSNCILPYWKDYDIYSITDNDYINWQNFIEDRNYSNNYKCGLHYLMSGFFEYCVNYLSLSFNYSKRVGCFKLKNVKVKHDYYTCSEFKKFIKGFDNNVYKLFFITMFITGLRPGETMALKFSDLSKYQLSIDKSISEHSFDGTRIIDTPKSFSSIRTVKITKKLYNSLIKLKSSYGSLDKDLYIFGGIKPLSPTTINRYKINACNKVGIRSIKLHEFRHSHASLLYDINTPIQFIKNRLGHSNITTTMDVYVHLNNKKEKRVLHKLNFLKIF